MIHRDLGWMIMVMHVQFNIESHCALSAYQSLLVMLYDLFGS